MTISIHALLAESDEIPYQRKIDQKNFYPRSPCGERPQVFQRIAKPFRISIHALLAESDRLYRLPLITLPISIHALLAESDTSIAGRITSNGNFYPRSPCGERLCTSMNIASNLEFLSTLSLRRATWLRCWQLAARDISIHALLAESDRLYLTSFKGNKISIHALLAESDSSMCIASNFQNAFLSTLSLRRATRPRRLKSRRMAFLSTLSLRRATIGQMAIQAIHNYFYPRSPCGERLQAYTCTGDFFAFLSTLSLRRATCYSLRHSAPRRDFYPRSPCGERRTNLDKFHKDLTFLSTLSLRRATATLWRPSPHC